MAIKDVNWVDLGNKEDNVESNQGKLTAEEWNGFVVKVKAHDDSITTLQRQSIKGIKLNNNEFTVQKDMDSNGILQLGTIGDKRTVSLKFSGYADGKMPKNLTIASDDDDSLKFTFTIDDKKANGESYTSVIGSSVTFAIIKGGTGETTVLSTIYGKADGDEITFDFKAAAKTMLSQEGEYSLSISYYNDGDGDSVGCTCNVVKLDVSFEPEFSDIYTASMAENSFPTVNARKGAVLHCTLNGQNIADIPFETSRVYLYDTIVKNSLNGTNTIRLYVSYEKNEVTITSKTYDFRYMYIKTQEQSKITSTVTENSEFNLYENVVINYIVYSNSASTNVKVIVSLNNDNTAILPVITDTVEIVNSIGRGTAIFSLMPKPSIKEDAIKSINNIKISCEELGISDMIPIVVKDQEVPFKQVTKGLIAYFDADGKTNDDKTWTSDITYNGKNYKYSMDLENIEFIPGSSGWYNNETNGSSLKLKRGKYCTLNYAPFEKEVAYTNGVSHNGLTISIEFATSKCFDDNKPVVQCIDIDDTGKQRGFVINTSNMTLSNNVNSLTTKFKENTRLRVDFVIDGTTTKYTYTTYVAENPAQNKYNQIPKRNQTSYEAYMIIYIDGVYAGVKEISADKVEFIQNNPQFIKFGSDYCDLDIYKIRIYNTALSVPQILSNYAYDANGIENKYNIAKRNDIFIGEDPTENFQNNPKIDRRKMEDNMSKLPIFTVKLSESNNYNDKGEVKEDAGELTNTKDKWQKTEISKYYDMYKTSANITVPLTSWETKPDKGQIRNQGTSSMGYPWPWRNWDWKTEEYFVPDVNGTATSRWLQYDNANYYPETELISKFGLQKLTFKKDYASSEMCNNAICSELFTDFALSLASIKSSGDSYKYIVKTDEEFDSVLSPSMATQFLSTKGNTDYRLSLKAKPCFMYQQFSYSPDGSPETKEGTAGEGFDAMGMMNLIPNKNEVGYLGFTKNKWENNKWNAKGEIKSTDDAGNPIELEKAPEQSWELTENKSSIYWKKPYPKPSLDADKHLVNDIIKDYEARTPKDSPIFNKANKFPEEQCMDFGHAPDDVALTDTQLNALTEQTENLRRFHNWLVQVDRGTCTNKPLITFDGVHDDPTSPYYYMDNITDLISNYSSTKNGTDLNNYDDLETANLTELIDDEAWRLRRFKTECKDYIIKNQWLLYYLWRELLWMYDSGFKNLQIYTIDGEHWGCMVRDADTAMGINNVGVDMFPPHLEDIDVYYIDETDGKIKFNYGYAKTIYNSDHIGSNSPVLNGQFGSIWVNIRDAFSSELEQMYKDLTNSGVTSDYLINMFRNHQENWCEALYNFGMRQYCFGKEYTAYWDAALGDKKHARTQWLERGKYYRDTKYNAYSGSDTATGRLKQHDVYEKISNNGNDNDYKMIDVPKNEDGVKLLKFETYIPCYIGLAQDSLTIKNIRDKFRVIDSNNDKSYTVDIPVGDGGLNILYNSDTNWYMYGTKHITSLGDLYKVCTTGDGNLNQMNFPLLRKLEFSHDNLREDGKDYYTYVTDKDGKNGRFVKLGSTVTTTAVQCSKMPELQCIDMSNMGTLKSLDDIDMCLQLEELYVRNTGITSLTLPATSTLHTLHLGSSISVLDMTNLTGLCRFVIGDDLDLSNKDVISPEAVSNLTNITITECSEYMSTKSEELINSCLTIDSNNNVISSVKRCKVTGVNWGYNPQRGAFDSRRLEYLLNIGATLEGKIKVDKMTTSLKLALVEAFKNVDDINNPLHVEYGNVKYIHSVKTKYDTYWLEPNNESLDMGSQLIFNYGMDDKYKDPNTMNDIKWSLSDNTYLDINPKTGVITRLDPEYTNPNPIQIICTISQYTGGDPTIDGVIEQRCDLILDKHIAKPGDVIYPDGSFASKYVSSDNPIGICFYVDENNPDNRLMFATKFITSQFISSGKPEPKYSWGLGKYYDHTVNDKSPYWSPLIDEDMMNQDIFTSVEDNKPTAYDINGLTNYRNLRNGLTDGQLVFKADGYVIDNNGIYSFDNELTKADALREIGFIKADKDIKTYFNYNKFNNKEPETIARKDDTIPYGLYNTSKIINTRNSALLTTGLGIFKVDGITQDNVIPYTNDNNSEWTMLTNNIDAIANVKLDGVLNKPEEGSEDFYYPAASFCWAYNPKCMNSSIREYDSKFSEHHWFLPAIGDATRIAYFINAVITNEFNNLSEGFKHFVESEDAKKDKIFNNLTQPFASCTEYVNSISNSIIQACIAGVGVKYSANGFTEFKSRPFNVLPICKF